MFAFGQTSSGKTFTMNGNAIQPGIIPQAIFDCFDLISGYKDREFLIRISYLEIYNEVVYDLLSNNSSRSRNSLAEIKIQQVEMDNIKGKPSVAATVLSGLKEEVVSDPVQVSYYMISVVLY